MGVRVGGRRDGAPTAPGMAPMNTDPGAPAIDRAQDWFRRFGGWLLAFGYFIPGVRHVTAIVAGSSSLDYRGFALYAYPGGALWCAVFLLLGYYAGDGWEEVARGARSNAAVAAAVVVCIGAAYVLIRMVNEHRRLQP